MKAAKQNEPIAQREIGRMYGDGQGVKQDYKKAFEYLEKAANQDHSAAQFVLATLYNDGLGVRQDYKQAKVWFDKACDNGEQQGCEEYARLNTQGY